MGRGLVVVVACVAACGFSPNGALIPQGDGGPGAAPDAHAPGDAPAVLDMGADAPFDAPRGSACGGVVWHADFSVDPTTIDRNGDDIDDFAVRGGGSLPGALTGGTWVVPANSAALDTQPKQPFTTRTVIDVTMQDVTRGSGAHSTICWINTAYTATAFAPLFLDLRRDADTADSQTVTVYGKMDPDAIESSIDAVSIGDDDLHHFHLDVDPTTLTYDLVIDGTTDRGRRSYYDVALGTNDDQWATVQALGGDSVFDDFQVEVCPP